MSLHTKILNYKPRFNDQFQCILDVNHKYIVYNNFDKQCNENNSIYKRSKPIDNISKKNLLNPRSLVAESTNPNEYNIQCELFPDKTEDLMKNKKNLTVTIYNKIWVI